MQKYTKIKELILTGEAIKKEYNEQETLDLVKMTSGLFKTLKEVGYLNEQETFDKSLPLFKKIASNNIIIIDSNNNDLELIINPNKIKIRSLNKNRKLDYENKETKTLSYCYKELDVISKNNKIQFSGLALSKTLIPKTGKIKKEVYHYPTITTTNFNGQGLKTMLINIENSSLPEKNPNIFRNALYKNEFSPFFTGRKRH